MYLVDGVRYGTITEVINRIDDGVGLKNRNKTITKLENMKLGEGIIVVLDYTELYLGEKISVVIRKKDRRLLKWSCSIEF